LVVAVVGVAILRVVVAVAVIVLRQGKRLMLDRR